MLRKIFFIGFSVINLSFSIANAQSEVATLYPEDRFTVKYVHAIEGDSFRYEQINGSAWIGLYESGDFYHWHGAIFAYSGLPPYIRNARIDSVKVFIQVSINSAAYKLKIVKLPNNDTTLSDSWSHLVCPIERISYRCSLQHGIIGGRAQMFRTRK